MIKPTIISFLGLFSLGAISTVNAASIVPTSYSYLSSPTGEQTAYLDQGNDLTNGVIATTGWGTGITSAEAYKYVGWKYKNPIISFNFSSSVSIDTLTLWADDANGAAGVRLPTQVLIEMGGTSVTRSISDPLTAVPLGLVFSNLNLTGSMLTLTVTNAPAWTMISEVQFSSVTPSAVPIPNAALLFAPALLGFIGLRRKMKKQQV